MADHFLRPAGFRLDRAQKFAAGRLVAEKLRHLQRGAGGAAVIAPFLRFAPQQRHTKAGVFAGRTGLQRYLGNGGDAGQRLAPETHRRHAVQLRGIGQLAGGVAVKGQRRLVRRNAGAVVDDADQVGAPGA